MRCDEFLRRAWSYSFDGGDNAYCVSTGGEFDFGTGSFSIAALLNPNAASGGAQRVIFSKGNVGTGATNRFLLWLETSIRPSILIQTVGSANEICTASAGLSAAWHEIIGVCDRTANQLRIYVDGAQAGTPVAISVTGSVTSSYPAIIGGSQVNGATANSLWGLLASLRVWKGTALSDAQVAAQFTRRSPYYEPTPAPTWATNFRTILGTTIVPHKGDSLFTKSPSGASPTISNSAFCAISSGVPL